MFAATIPISAISALPTAIRAYDYCINLDDSYIRYKKHAIFLREVAETVEQYYLISGCSIPDVESKLIKNIEDFEEEVKNIREKTLVRRLWRYKRSGEKLNALKDELDLL